MKFFRSLFRQFALDLGTARSRIWLADDGLIIDQPTCLVTTPNGEVMGTGDEAVEIASRRSQELKVSWPVREALVADEQSLLALLKIWLRPYMKPPFLVQPTMLVSVPAEGSKTNRSVIRSICAQLGAVEVITIAQPLAAAIGAGVHTADATGSFYLHLGHGVVEAGVVSLGSIMVSRQSVLAGQYLTEQMQLLLRNDFDLELDLELVEELKRSVFSFQPAAARSEKVMGKSTKTQRPVEQVVKAEQFAPLAELLYGDYVELLYQVLQASPPALLVDSLDKGLLLSGGLAQLHGLDRRLSDEFKMPVSVVEDPELAVITGMNQVLAHLPDFRQSLSYHSESV